MRTRTVSVAALIAALIALAASCSVPDPAPGETMKVNWGPPKVSHRNVSYGPHAENTADIYLPAKGGNRGVIVMVHGGGFVSGQRADAINTFGPILAQTHRGFGLVNVSYRLQGHGYNPFPNAVTDVATAVNWVRAHGSKYGLNPRTVIVAGHSAGGTLASLVGPGANGAGPKIFPVTAKVDGWVSVAGVNEFRSNTNATVRAIGAAWLIDVAGRGGQASTVGHLDRWDPPGYLVHGDLDSIVPVGQAHALLGAAAEKGVATSRLYYDIVDTGSVWCRNHEPKCGMNANIFNFWVDQVHDRAL